MILNFTLCANIFLMILNFVLIKIQLFITRDRLKYIMQRHRAASWVLLFFIYVNPQFSGTNQVHLVTIFLLDLSTSQVQVYVQKC